MTKRTGYAKRKVEIAFRFKGKKTWYHLAWVTTDKNGRFTKKVKAYGSGYYQLILDRKSTRLNSSHQIISYAVFCLKKKKQYSNGKLRTKNDTKIDIIARHQTQDVKSYPVQEGIVITLEAISNTINITGTTEGHEIS